MGCSRRTKYEDIRPEQKWDFISLNDFKSTSCFEPFAYGYLWVSLVISIAVYGVDTFTAVNLLAFNKWSSQIEPAIPVKISKWIFSICIILSWINLAYEHIRAYRVMKRGAVAESYLDSLAVRLQSIRLGQGRGWRRFLVFAELTKSKKGAEYVALFTYFSFQSWIRVIFCQGPRQVLNALTLWAVFQAKLDPKATNVGNSFIQFFKNIGILAESQYQQAVILSGMMFTLVVWVFAAISLLLGLLCYILFLWHYIPNSDGGLTGYCERKINERLTRIVSAKVNKALEEEDRKTRKAAQKAAKRGEKPVLGRQATLPTLFAEKSDDKLPNMPMLGRNDTMTTLPLYTSRPGTPSTQNPSVPAFELSNLEQKRPFNARTDTESSAMSNASYGSNAPLIGAAADMGYGRSASPAPSMNLDDNGYPFPQRTMTANSNASQWQRDTPQPNRRPVGTPSRQLTQDSYNTSTGPSRTNTPGYPPDSRGPPSRQMTQDSYRGPPSRQGTQDGYTASPIGYGDSFSNSRPTPPPFGEFGGRNTPDGRASPAPSQRGQPGPSGPGYPMTRTMPHMNTDSVASTSSGSTNFSNFNPNPRSASAGIPGNMSPAPSMQRPYRNMTEPVQQPQSNDYFNQTSRQETPQSLRIGSSGTYDPYRSESPASFNGRPNPGPQQQGGYRR